MPDIKCSKCGTIYDPSTTGGKCPGCSTKAPFALPPRTAGAGIVAAPGTAAPRTGMPPGFWAKTGGGIAGALAKGGSTAAYKYIRGRYVTAAIIIFAGVLLGSVGTPAIAALGLPSIKAMFLSIALIFYAVYYLIPNHHQIMADVRWADRWKCPYSMHPTIACTEPPLIGTKRLSHPPKTEGNHPQAFMEPIDPYTLLEGSHYGWLYGRSAMKILAISFAALEFSPLAVDTFPFKHILIPIIFLFWAYFSMPTGYKKSEPYKAAEAWFRMILGITLAALVMSFLTPNPSGTFTMGFWGQLVGVLFFAIIIAFVGMATEKMTQKGWITYLILLIIMGFIIPVLSAFAPIIHEVPGVSVFFLILAFFATFPERRTKEPKPGEEPEAEEEEEVKIKFGLANTISEGLESYREKTNIVGNMIFITLALFGGIPVLTWAGGGMALQIAYGVVWAMSILMGIVGGRESRPYMGMIVMLLTIISFSFAYSSTLGAAVFGTYWGTVQHTGEVFFGPMADSMNKASCEAYANYQCITVGPVACADEKMKCQRKQGEAEGSDRSIDIVEFVASPKEVGYDVNKQIPNTTVYVTIENTGDYDANNVRFTVLGHKQGYPNVTYIEITEKYKAIGETYMESCVGGKDVGGNTCEWEGTFRKGSRGVVNFVIDWNAIADNLLPAECGVGDKNCVWQYYYGQYPKLGMNSSFDYQVSSRYEVNVRSSEEMTKLLQEGTDVAGTISRYTGGPIVASVWTPKYVESGKTTFLSAALTNNKEGTATDAKYCLYIPEEAGTPVYKSGGHIEDARDCAPMEGTTAVECYWKTIKPVTAYDQNTMKPQNFGECTFSITPDIGVAPQKQLVITGNTTFHYEILHIRKDVPLVG